MFKKKLNEVNYEKYCAEKKKAIINNNLKNNCCCYNFIILVIDIMFKFLYKYLCLLHNLSIYVYLMKNSSIIYL